MKGIIKTVCISEAKGTPKVNIGEGLLIEDFGLENDAHAGKWHRQVSLLSWDKIEAFRRDCYGKTDIPDGAFGENLAVEGIDFASLPVGTVFEIGEAVLQLTQIGKECHDGCIIAKTVGKCIMPTQGVFAIVLKGGRIKIGDVFTVKE